MARPPANVSGELLQRGYVLLGKLVRGQTSTIYEAQHEATRRRVALKVTAQEPPDEARMAGRLLTAWNVARGLRHPHVVTVLDAGRLSDGRGWLVMERLRGRDLQMELDEVGRLPVSRAVHIMRQVVVGLAVLHRRGAVHRGVEPANIYLSSAGHFADHAKLVDLGRLAVGEDDPVREHAPTGPFNLGTPRYLPPELARGETPSPRADFYAVGAVLYHLLAGHPPFDDDEPIRLVAKHVNSPVPPLPADLDAPEGLAELVMRCLAKEPTDRPPSAEAVLARLDDSLMRVGGPPAESASPAPALPALPTAGVAAEWARYADHLRRMIRSHFGRSDKAPPAMVDALHWVTAARTSLDEAVTAAERQRTAADHRARARIAQRQDLEQRVFNLDRSLKAAEEKLREAEHAVFIGVRARERVDEDYRKALRHIEIASSGVTLRAGDLVPLLGQVRALLARRSELEAKVTQRRNAEREAAESVALLMAERLEVLRAHADVELEEQGEGQRSEWLAARAADDVLSAQRAFENACLNLQLRCVELIEAG